MKLWKTAAVAALLTLAAMAAQAEEITYQFDSVSAFDLQRRNVIVKGILRNASTVTTLSWLENNPNLSFKIDRCTPLFLTMVEKPGRYYLNLIIDTNETSSQTASCGLELKN
jgi:hypothetical protein